MHAAMAFMMQRTEKGARTNEIMARFRPIAPKPPALTPALGSSARSSMPYGQCKHGRQEDYCILPPCQLQAPVWWPTIGASSEAQGSMGTSMPMGPLLAPTGDEHLVDLSLAVPRDWAPSLESQRVIPVEQDLLSKLQETKVITPHPVRPLRTTIYIDFSNIVEPRFAATTTVSKKTAKEVEAEVERDTLPVVVSDCHNRVLLVNDAYKGMVGQPVCTWLDYLPGVSASRRINGEVVLKVLTSIPYSRLSNTGVAFPCTARITWEIDGATASLTVPCAAEHLSGNSGNYSAIWRFDSARASIIYCIA